MWAKIIENECQKKCAICKKGNVFGVSFKFSFDTHYNPPPPKKKKIDFKIATCLVF